MRSRGTPNPPFHRRLAHGRSLPAITFFGFVLTAMFAGWAGCGSGGSSTSHSGGTGASTSSGNPNAGGASGSGGTGTATGGMSATGGNTGTGADGGMTDGDGSTGCTSTQKFCDGKCVDQSDPNYGCSPTFCTPCSTYQNAQAACMGGQCALGACSTGFKNCDGNDSNGCETNTGNDPMNCGACGSPCVVPHATASCSGGMCGIGTCDTGWTDCNSNVSDGCEANLQSDPMNCGQCGTACQGDQTCVMGMCSLICSKGTTNCPTDPPNKCATMLGTNKNCNFCGDTCNPANTADAQCQPNTMPPPAPAYVCQFTQCSPGFANCDSIAQNGCETNTNTDANNCNSCGNVCPSGPHSTAVCNSAVCAIICDPGYFDCDKDPTNGCEVNGNTDPNNCDGCGNVCNAPNGTPACVAGQCSIAMCNSGFKDCDMQVPDGCEINTTNDPKNCGACGTLCSEQNGTAVCNMSACALGPCNPGFANCDGKYTTGCNINTNTDTNNCGACNTVCNLANATPTCNAGACQIATCNAGFQDCDHQPGDGCEINTTNNTSNCGACGTICNTPNATPACQNGSCAIATCNPNYKDCDGQIADGCEVNIMNDPNNCGACGVKCALTNATAACTNGVCTIAACNPGFADCDKNPTNGCEVNINNDTNNCGGCGMTCKLANATASCAGGTCQVSSCNPGFQNCNNLPADGCEVNTNGDPNNCGGCGHVCNTPNATPGCGNGLCTIAMCNPNFGNCDGNVANGCEIDLTSNNSNCGSCGNACLSACGGSNDHVTATQCTNSACQVTGCSAGYQDFDGTCSDGCECVDSNTQATCPAAQNLYAGTLPIGGTTTPVTSTMAPLTVTQAWFTIILSPDTGTAGPGGTGFNVSYHPKITLTSSKVVGGVPEFVFDVDKDCSNDPNTTVACTDNGSNKETQMTTWETAWSGPKTPTENAIPTPGNGGQVWIKVYRNPAFPMNQDSCGTYTLTVSN